MDNFYTFIVQELSIFLKYYAAISLWKYFETRSLTKN